MLKGREKKCPDSNWQQGHLRAEMAIRAAGSPGLRTWEERKGVWFEKTSGRMQK